MILEIKSMSDDDIKAMTEQIRPMDQLEFEIMSKGMTVDRCLSYMRDRSDAKAAYINGKLVCCYGAIKPTLLSTDVHPWLCATSEIEKSEVRREFLKRSRSEMVSILGGFKSAWNYVHQDNKIAIRWLKWLGFDFDTDLKMLSGHGFYRFNKEF